jgi:hypothetical protein
VPKTINTKIKYFTLLNKRSNAGGIFLTSNDAFRPNRPSHSITLPKGHTQPQKPRPNKNTEATITINSVKLKGVVLARKLPLGISVNSVSNPPKGQYECIDMLPPGPLPYNMCRIEISDISATKAI